MGLDDKLAAVEAARAAQREAQAAAEESERPAVAAACKRFAELASERHLPVNAFIAHRIGSDPNPDGWTISTDSTFPTLFVSVSGDLFELSSLYTERTGETDWFLHDPPFVLATILEDWLASRLASAD